MKIYAWCVNNHLLINTNKTKCIQFKLKENNADIIPKIIIHSCEKICHCKEIEVVENLKYLGLTFDKGLKWNKHTEILNNYLKRMNYIFYYIKNILKKYIEIAYYSLVQSHISYGIMGFGTTYNKYLKSIFKLQKNIIRNVYKNNKITIDNSIFLNIKQLLIYKIIQYFEKHKDLVKLNNHSLRKQTFLCPQPKCEKFKQCYSYLYSKIFNHLP